MNEAELANALATSGPAGIGVVVLAVLLRSWLGTVREDLKGVREKLSQLEATMSRASLDAATHHTEARQRLAELERRVTVLEGPKGRGS